MLWFPPAKFKITDIYVLTIYVLTGSNGRLNSSATCFTFLFFYFGYFVHPCFVRAVLFNVSGLYNTLLLAVANFRCCINNNQICSAFTGFKAVAGVEGDWYTVKIYSRKVGRRGYLSQVLAWYGKVLEEGFHTTLLSDKKFRKKNLTVAVVFPFVFRYLKAISTGPPSTAIVLIKLSSSCDFWEAGISGFVSSEM